MSEEYYAFIKDGNIVNIAVFDSPTIETLEYFKNHHEADLLLPVDNTVIIGGTYDGAKFWKPQPYLSWVKNEETNEWEAPLPMPEDMPHKYVWNEEIVNWDLAPISEQPFDSWTFNSDEYVWEAPLPYPGFDPENPKFYAWNEELLNWEEIQVSE